MVCLRKSTPCGGPRLSVRAVASTSPAVDKQEVSKAARLDVDNIRVKVAEEKARPAPLFRVDIGIPSWCMLRPSECHLGLRRCLIFYSLYTETLQSILTSRPDIHTHVQLPGSASPNCWLTFHTSQWLPSRTVIPPSSTSS
jgi:hypothetical protein